MGGLSRRGRSAELALLIVFLFFLFPTAHGAECTWEGSLPCTFGPCSFSTDASGVLDVTRSCPAQTGTLWLGNKGITALRDGVFDNMGACTGIILGFNQLSNLSAMIFRGLARLESLSLDRNKLSSLPETMFNGLTSLGYLDLSNNSFNHLPEMIFKGLTKLYSIRLDHNKLRSLPEILFNDTRIQFLHLSGNRLRHLPEKIFKDTRLGYLYLSGNKLSHLPEKIFNGLTLRELVLRFDPAQGYAAESDNGPLSCVPLTQADIAGLSKYSGPRSTCEYSNCTAGNAGPIGGTCTPCAAGKYSPMSGVTACVDCGAGTYQATAGVIRVCVRLHTLLCMYMYVIKTLPTSPSRQITTHMNTYIHSLSLSHTHTHTLTYFHTHTRTRTHTHTQLLLRYY